MNGKNLSNMKEILTSSKIYGNTVSTSRGEYMNREQALDKAKSLISGQRQADYGDPTISFNKIAEYWSAYLGKKLNAEDVSIMMALMKVARITTGSGTEDSFIDALGYIAIGTEIHTKKENK